MECITGKLVLDASSGTLVGDPIRCNARQSVLFIGYRAEASVAFSGSTLITFLGSADPVDDDAATAPALFGLEHITLTPTGVTIAAGNATTAFSLTLADVTAGARGVIRIVNPPPVVIPKFTYGAGGGTYRVRLKAVV